MRTSRVSASRAHFERRRSLGPVHTKMREIVNFVNFTAATRGIPWASHQP
jgi:hypothetical protein